MAEMALLVVTMLLAYSHGANDNFKGVATLYGRGVLGYRQARSLSTLATLPCAALIGALAYAAFSNLLL
jgi:inorganic phosphate transporter, PiT family